MFGKSIDNPERLARTVLCYMMKCLYGGPEFITKILPASQLTADFILNQVQPIVDEINKQENRNVIGIKLLHFALTPRLFKMREHIAVVCC